MPKYSNYRKNKSNKKNKKNKKVKGSKRTRKNNHCIIGGKFDCNYAIQNHIMEYMVKFKSINQSNDTLESKIETSKKLKKDMDTDIDNYTTDECRSETVKQIKDNFFNSLVDENKDEIINFLKRVEYTIQELSIDRQILTKLEQEKELVNQFLKRNGIGYTYNPTKTQTPWRPGGSGGGNDNDKDFVFDNVYTTVNGDVFTGDRNQSNRHSKYETHENNTKSNTANVLKALGYGACVIGFAAIGFIFFGFGAVVTGVVGLICCLGPSVCPNIIAAAAN